MQFKNQQKLQKNAKLKIKKLIMNKIFKVNQKKFRNN